MKLRISKRGDEGLRRLLVQSAHYCRSNCVSGGTGEDQAAVAVRQTTRHRCSRQEAGCAAPSGSQEVTNLYATAIRRWQSCLNRRSNRHCLTVDTLLEVVYALVG